LAAGKRNEKEKIEEREAASNKAVPDGTDGYSGDDCPELSVTGKTTSKKKKAEKTMNIKKRVRG